MLFVDMVCLLMFSNHIVIVTVLWNSVTLVMAISYILIVIIEFTLVFYANIYTCDKVNLSFSDTDFCFQLILFFIHRDFCLQYLLLLYYTAYIPWSLINPYLYSYTTRFRNVDDRQTALFTGLSTTVLASYIM